MRGFAENVTWGAENGIRESKPYLSGNNVYILVMVSDVGTGKKIFIAYEHKVPLESKRGHWIP